MATRPDVPGSHKQATPANDPVTIEQEAVLLEDSEMRSADRSAAPGSFVERRRSEDTVPPTS